ncbi:MAG: hypothetical protein GX770_04810 [Firmicutes bacterium]|nr:hypothetical protein [Bacillota bacterium]
MTPIEIIIIADGEATACCDQAPDLETQIRYLAQGLTLAYGEQLTVEFLDLNRDQDHPRVQQALAAGRKFPLLLYNREVKFEGGIPLLALKTLFDRAGLVPRTAAGDEDNK